MRFDLRLTDFDVFFISDLHLFHKNIIEFDNRPFRNEFNEPDLKIMHETIINNWNSVVKSNDIVFLLGDVIFSSPNRAKETVHMLNGKINLILGNHNRIKEMKKLERFDNILDYAELWLNLDLKEQYHIILSHYPILSWNRQRYGSIMLHGHCHGNLYKDPKFSFIYENNNRIIDVGCNLHNYTPINIVDIKNILKINNNK